MRDLQFACKPGCTACCNMQGYVYLSEADLSKAAAFVGLSVEAFQARYVYRTRNMIRLRKPRHSQCPFLLGDGCSIHPAKPTQCRTFPFWPELVENRSNWEAAGSYCPGIGTGPLIQIGTAMEIAAEMKQTYPGHYE